MEHLIKIFRVWSMYRAGRARRFKIFDSHTKLIIILKKILHDQTYSRQS